EPAPALGPGQDPGARAVLAHMEGDADLGVPALPHMHDEAAGVEGFIALVALDESALEGAAAEGGQRGPETLLWRGVGICRRAPGAGAGGEGTAEAAAGH